MPKISVRLDEKTHQLAKIKALTSKPPRHLMDYVRSLIEQDLRRSRNGKRTT